MHPYDEMKAYVGFTSEDGERLRRAWPLLEGAVHPVIDHFYAKILDFPDARSVLQSEAQVERLKKTLRIWLREALSGPWDTAYFTRRERIGRRHVEVGLHSRYMFTAMNVILQDLEDVARRLLPEGDCVGFCVSLQRVLHLDLAIMTGTFVEGRERRQLDTLQELLVNHLRVMVLLVSTDLTVAAATRPTTDLLCGAPVLGVPWTEAIPPALLAAGELEERVAHALRSGREIMLPRVDIDDEGQVRSFRVQVVPLDHPLARFMVQVEELTDAVTLEGRLRRSEALAQLGSLSAAVAHELRNPLAGISGALQVISRSLPEGASYAPIMRKVEQEIHRLDTLVTELLAFARPGSARLRGVALRDAAEQALDLVRADWPLVVFEVVGEGHARADPDLVRQILLNLLQNAAQAVEGQGRVQLVIGDGRLVIADDGPGIPEDKREKLFEPFYTTRTRGTGLGLAISRRAAVAMMGNLRVAPSGPLPGAAFLLELERGET